MSGMYGADVAQLRALAQQFSAAAERLDANRMTVGNAIQISAWIGPVAVRFRHQWDSDYSRKVQAAAARLREAAHTLRANADDQERASAVDGDIGVAAGSTSTASGDYAYTPEQVADFEKLLELIKVGDTVVGASGDTADLLAALASGNLELKSFSEWVGKVKGLDGATLLSLAGMGITAKELGEAIGTNDPAATLEASLDLAMGAVGINVPAAGLAWGIGKFLGESGYNSLQSFYDSPSSALDFAARQLYGDTATFDGLEQYQRDVIMERYEGMEGLIASAVDHGGGAAYDFWNWITGHGGRGAR